jgi:MIP family channel proteins
MVERRDLVNINAWLTESDIKAVVAELVGTFIFFFIGAGSIVTMNYIHASQQAALVVIALAHGLVLSVVVTSIGHISGGHLNPAVTIGLWVAQRIATPLAILYIAAQLIGGIIAGFLLKAIFSSAIWEPVHLGTPSLAPGVAVGTGILIEAILTFFLVFAVFGTAVDPRHPRVGGFGIGLTVLFDILVGGPLTGASMNPARTFGPAVAANYWTDDYVYWIGPILGGILAALIYGYLLMPHEEVDIASAPTVPGSDVLPVPVPETNPYLEEETSEPAAIDESPSSTETEAAGQEQS